MFAPSAKKGRSTRKNYPGVGYIRGRHTRAKGGLRGRVEKETDKRRKRKREEEERRRIGRDRIRYRTNILQDVGVGIPKRRAESSGAVVV